MLGKEMFWGSNFVRELLAGESEINKAERYLEFTTDDDMHKLSTQKKDYTCLPDDLQAYIAL